MPLNYKFVSAENKELVNKKRILVWGYGIEGKSAVDLLLTNAPKGDIFVATKDSLDDKNEDSMIRFIRENEILSNDFDVLIKSPGVSMYRNEMDVLRSSGIQITSALNIFLAETKEYKNLKTIGITGTKGKSTTSSITKHMLEVLGFRVALVGNIGVSFFSIVDDLSDYDYIVLELSSCQLANINGMLDYGILLNLYPEHRDWHQTHENYFRDKLKILKHSKKYFLDPHDPITARCIANDAELDADGKNYFNSTNGFHIENEHIFYGKQELYDSKLSPNIRGNHIYRNLCAILAVLKEEKLNIADALNSLRNFKTLKHRLEIFCRDEEHNVSYVDDSISTIPEATIEALKTFGDSNIFLILGGFDRQQSYDDLVKFIKTSPNVKKIFLMGQTGKRLESDFKKFAILNVEYFDNFENLVSSVKRTVAEMSKRDKRPPLGNGAGAANYGDNHTNHTNSTNSTNNNSNNDDGNIRGANVVLLSPAAASFDNFKNFEERGDIFERLVIGEGMTLNNN